MSRSSARTSAAALLLGASWVAGLAAAVSACGDIGDASYVPPQVTPLNAVDIANKPFCVDTCAPDYGSTRINCKAEEGLEFFPVPVLDPDNGMPVNPAATPPPVTGFYAYNDGTSDFMAAGRDKYDPKTVTNNNNYPGANGASNYQPQAALVHDRCGPDGKPGDAWVHHLRGGLFTEWGGGMGRRLQNFVTAANALNAPSPACSGTGPASPTDPDYCPDADERIESVADLPANSMLNLRSNYYGMVVDLRGWEGISFWARQGPNNTAAIRVYVADRQLDEDVSALEYNAGLTPMCGRTRECGCRNHRPCTDNAPEPGYSCWDPQIDTPPAALHAQQGDPFYNPYDICGSYLCDAPNPAWPNIVDSQFATPDHPAPDEGTAQCQLYKLTNDLQTYYCYDQNEPRSYPPNAPDQCGDGWEKGVALSTDWQFYTIPFTELRQEGYGKMFSYLDLSKITLVRFSWMQGWLDIWLDDVRFYRHARNATQTP